MQVRAYVLRCGLETHPFLGSYLVSILAELGCIENAQRAFDNLITISILQVHLLRLIPNLENCAMICSFSEVLS